MGRYLLRRTLQAIPLLVGISALVFVLIQMTPGGPISLGETAASGRMTAEDLERLRNRYGLDQPLYVQYARWGADLVRGDWGTSFNTGQPVLTMIRDRIPTTLLLTGLALGMALALAIPIGVFAAMRQYSWFDYFSTGVAFFGISIPSFWLALMLLFLFSYTLDWLPSVGLTDPRRDHAGWDGLWDRARHLIMPVGTLALVSTAGLTRFVRSSMLDVIGQDYVRTARAKGLRERVVVTVHAFKNAAIPFVTVLALEIPDLFIGAVVIESIFAISGMGRLFVESANLRDYPVLMGIVMVTSVIVIVSNLVADAVYGWLDPRISFK